MHYKILAPLFFMSLIIALTAIASVVFKLPFYTNNKKKIRIVLACWFIPYIGMILFMTGPTDLSKYPPREQSPYKLPWKSGTKRFVAQGNRSFTSHRDYHEYAWDFVMPNGTEIVAARAGRVTKIEDSFEGVGLNSNIIEIEHEDGERSGYAHIQHKGTLVKLGDEVKQGQPIALSGMVGQTIFPHVHFFVVNKEGTNSIPITFADIPEGIPKAGYFYNSSNQYP